MPDPRLNALRQLAGRAMDADGDYDDSSGFDSPAEERAEYEPVRIPLRDVRAAVDPRMEALYSLAGRPSDPLLNRAVPGYDGIPILEDMTMLPGGRTAAVDDLREAGALSTGLARKQWPENLRPTPHERATYMHGDRPMPSMGAQKSGSANPVKDAGGIATSAERALYGTPPERELTDAEYDEMQRERNRRAVIEREVAMAQVAVPRGAPYAEMRGAGASRATTGQAQMTPEELARTESLRRHYEGR